VRELPPIMKLLNLGDSPHPDPLPEGEGAKRKTKKERDYEISTQQTNPSKKLEQQLYQD